jgi:dTMP kinase
VGGLALDRLAALEQWVQGGLQPDLTLLFDVPLETASARLAGAREPDKFEAESRAFFERTRTEYLRRAAEAPQRFRVIDATRSIDEIRVTLEEILATL